MSSTISTGWSSSSIISDVLPEEEYEENEEEEEDELVLTDNERMRGRVEELEKIVLQQRNEIMLLQSSTVEILRRLQNLENQDKSQSLVSSMGYNSLPRSIPRISGSKSTYSMSPSPNAPPLPRHHSTSKSMHTNNNNNHKDNYDVTTTPRRSHTRGGDMVNVSVGKSARGSPLRKWVSNHDIKETDKLRRHSTSSEASTSATITMNPIVNSVRRLSMKNPRTCHFSSGSPTLPIFVNGKSVQVPVPTGYENLDPTSDQEPPSVKATLKHVYSYRGKDVRSNIEMLPTGELVFFSANMVVLMNVTGDNRSQRIYHGHTCDVKWLVCI
uniref:HELP domain-containing protein n=1 Tax=Caenorhabditis japonica TaxID=281687 RepID=A0A8R1E3I7_CAEJA